MAGVAVATAAIVIVLSVFNGFSKLAGSQLSIIDPDIKVVPAASKVFAGDSLALVLEGLDEVSVAMPVLQERALLVAGSMQMPVVVKGVEPSLVGNVVSLDDLIVDGVYRADNGLPDSVAGIQIASGVAMYTGLRPSPYAVAEIYMPRRIGRINPANPAASYRQLAVSVTGVFQVNQPDYDSDKVWLPLADVRRMLDYETGEASAIEIKLAKEVTVRRAVSAIRAVLGDDCMVLDRQHQQADTFRMIAVEKWITFLILVFILVIASFNIVSTLSLMVIEKRDDMSTLRALGATRRMVSSVFVIEGGLITIVGGCVGIIAGALLSLAQQYFGIIKLGADPTMFTVDAYPVVLNPGDVAIVFVTVFLTGFIIAQISRIFTRKIK